MIMQIVLFPLLAALGLLIVAAVIAALFSVATAVLPVNKVPLSYNLRNIAVRWKTTLVTALAFTLVTAILTVMLAFVQGMFRITQSSAVAENVIILADGAADETFSDVQDTNVRAFPADVQAAIATMPRKPGAKAEPAPMFSKEVYVLVSHVVQQAADGVRQRRFIQMRGLEDPVLSAAVHNITLAEGEWFSKGGGVRSVPDPKGASAEKVEAMEIVVGSGLATTLGADLGKDRLRPGDVLPIGPTLCYVAGVMNPSGAFGSEIWGLDTQIKRPFNRQNYSSFVVRTKSEELAGQVASKLRKFGAQSYNSFTEKAYYERQEESNRVFQIAVLVLGVIMAIGGVLGVMNTMFAAISQRAKDIGVLRLLGFTRWQILCSFLLESLLIAVVGGALGCALGFLFNGLTANGLVGGQGGGKSIVLTLVVDGSVLATGMLFAVVMGAVGGLIPSINAMRLRPLESLR